MLLNCHHLIKIEEDHQCNSRYWFIWMSMELNSKLNKTMMKIHENKVILVISVLQADNPLFQTATTTVANPIFTGE